MHENTNTYNLKPASIPPHDIVQGIGARVMVETGRTGFDQDVANIEARGWAADVPDFKDQVKDQSRINTFRYLAIAEPSEGRHPYVREPVVPMTEHEGLVGLDKFVTESKAMGLKDLIGDDLTPAIEDFEHDLRFIGGKEFATATEGFKTLWQSYLDADPELQLCVVTKISENEGERKSDKHVTESVMALFTDEEKRQYEGRILNNVHDITQDPEHVKIIIPDDRSNTGAQLMNALYKLRSEVKDDDYVRCFEVNLIAATDVQITEGIHLNKYSESEPPLMVPVKSFYRAPSRTRLNSPHLGFAKNTLTSVDSAMDYGYNHFIYMLVDARRRRGENVVMPPMTNIIRDYRYLPGEEPAPFDPQGFIDKGGVLEEDT